MALFILTSQEQTILTANNPHFNIRFQDGTKAAIVVKAQPTPSGAPGPHEPK